MNASKDPLVLHLDRAMTGSGILRIPHARGVRVSCLSGELWVTEDRSSEDIILSAGETRTLQSPGLALVTALENADVQVEPGSTVCSRVGLLSPIVQHDFLSRARELRRQALHEWLDGLSRFVHRVGARLAHQ